MRRWLAHRGEPICPDTLAFEAERSPVRLEIAAPTAVRFKPGKSLKDALNGGGAPAARSSR
jgi:hypothetical protein